MVYIIYKDESNKEEIENNLININRFLYKDDNQLKKLYKKVALIDYNSINNKELLKKIDSSKLEYYDDDINLYYKYNEIEDYTKIKTLIGITTCFNSEKDNCEYFSLFYTTLIERTLDKLTNNKREKTIVDDMTDFALIAFSNREDVYDNNDLMYGFLYDQKSIEDKYDKIMGEGAFRELTNYTRMVDMDYSRRNVVTNYEFNQIMNRLKEYFYKKMSILDNISMEEKNNMINKFDSLYKDIIDKKQSENKKKMF